MGRELIWIKNTVEILCRGEKVSYLNHGITRDKSYVSLSWKVGWMQ